MQIVFFHRITRSVYGKHVLDTILIEHIHNCLLTHFQRQGLKYPKVTEPYEVVPRLKQCCEVSIILLSNVAGFSLTACCSPEPFTLHLPSHTKHRNKTKLKIYGCLCLPPNTSSFTPNYKLAKVFDQWLLT